jgi:hypothetical protein
MKNEEVRILYENKSRKYGMKLYFKEVKAKKMAHCRLLSPFLIFLIFSGISLEKIDSPGKNRRTFGEKRFDL